MTGQVLDWRDCQIEGRAWVKAKPAAYLIHPMGAGKTVTTLSAIDDLMFDRFEIDCCLVVAPAKVVETGVWEVQAARWRHLQGLVVQRVAGTAEQRLQALGRPADVYVISRENLAWLAKTVRWRWDMLVWDESSGIKDQSTVRFKTMRKLRPKLKRLVMLSGTPAPNDLGDLWPAMYLLDWGERLGRTMGAFHARWFKPDKRNGHQVFSWKLTGPEAETAIYDKIADIAHQADVDLGVEQIDNQVDVDLGKHRQAYLDFERDCLLEIDEQEITAVNAGVLCGKLQQYAQGAIYAPDKSTVEVHDIKLAVLDELIEGAMGKPVVVVYWFKHDLARLQRRYPHGEKFEGEEVFKRFVAREVPLLFVHPASGAHGVDGLQQASNVLIFFCLTWSGELRDQVVKRLARPGQRETVIVHSIVMEGTVDEDIVESVQHKSEVGSKLRDALIARRRRWT